MAHHRRYQPRVTPTAVANYESDYADADGDYDGEPRAECWHCCGQGWGIIGTDWDSDDPINGPYPGEVETCPCCHGSGDAEDCTFW